MKIHMKKLSATIALIMMMTITVSMMSLAYAPDIVVPLGPLEGFVSTTMYSQAIPRPIGVGQNLTLEVVLYPPPALDVNITWRLACPNGTYLYFQGDSSSVTGIWNNNSANVLTLHGTADFPQLEYITVFQPDVPGIWNLQGSFAGMTVGDTYYRPCTGPIKSGGTIPVQPDPVVMPNPNIVSSGYIGTSPGSSINPGKIATGESIYIVGWVSPPRDLQRGIFHTPFDFIITKPDGTKETITKKADSAATASFSYVCTQAGTYSAVLDFAGEVFPTMQNTPCTSPPVTWQVEDGYATPRWVEEPLPTGQWTYPINAEFQQWYQISGPWPISSARFDASNSQWNPNTKGPNSAHVLWAEDFEDTRAGIIGGETPVGGDSKAFTAQMPGFVAWQGYLWYTTTQLPPSTTAGVVPSTQPVVVMVDQFTGKEIKRVVLPGTGSVSLTLELNPREKIDPTQEESVGVTTNLWAIGNGLRLLNPFSLQCSYYNSTFTPSFYYNHNFYQTSTTSDGEQWIMKWSTEERRDVWKVPAGQPTSSGSGFFLDPTVDPPRLVNAQRSYGDWPVTIWLKSWNANTGQLICNGTLPWPAYATEATGSYCVAYGNFYFHDYSMRLIAVSTETAKEVWKSEPQVFPWGDFAAYNIAYGYHLIYMNCWDGYQYAYVAETGDTAWKAFSAESNGETAMGQYAWWGNTIVGDQKCYSATAQHTQPSPPSRGDALYAINALTGEQIWKLDNFQAGGGNSIASGVLTYGNAYDGRVYAFSQGPTQTTVTAPLTTQPLGTPVLIQGTVMDMSPGAPNTPCVSDDSQNQWMQYLYQNKPMPTNATGVVVHLEYVGPDGTKKDMTHVTTNLMGSYSYLWTPPTEGAYTVIATMDPTDSYYKSIGNTAVGVGPAAAEPVEPQSAPDNTMLMYGILAVAIIAAVLAAVAVMLVMRKK